MREGEDGVILPTGGFLAAALRVGGYDRTIVAVEHGNLFDDEKKSIFRRAVRRLVRAMGAQATDVDVAVSDYTLERMRERVHAAKLVRIYNGIDLREYRPPHPGDLAGGQARKNAVVAYGGRLIPGKGVEELLRAFRLVRESTPCVLEIAGDGPEMQGLQELSENIGIADSVTFLGTVQNMAAFWRRCQFAVVPSNGWTESFCMSAAEAMACGRPVVAVNRGALPEVVVDGESGTLCKAGDVLEIAEAIKRYLRNDALRIAHGAGARKRCEQLFGIEVCASQYIDLFEGKRATATSTRRLQ